MRKYQAGEPVSAKALAEMATIENKVVFIVPLNRTKLVKTVLGMPYISVVTLLKNGHICEAVQKPKVSRNEHTQRNN